MTIMLLVITGDYDYITVGNYYQRTLCQEEPLIIAMHYFLALQVVDYFANAETDRWLRVAARLLMGYAMDDDG